MDPHLKRSIASALLFNALLSMVLFITFIKVGMDVFEASIYVIWAVIQTVAAYILAKPRELIDFIKNYTLPKHVDMSATQFSSGLLLITLTPLIYKLQGPIYAQLSLFMGGVLIVLAVVGYVLLEEQSI